MFQGAPAPSGVSRERGQKRSFTQREMAVLQDSFLALEPQFSIGSLVAEKEVTFFLSAVHHTFTLMTQVSAGWLAGWLVLFG